MHPDWKGRSKIVFADDMIFFADENSKDATKNLLELTSEFSEVAGCKNQCTEKSCISIHWQWNIWIRYKKNNFIITASKAMKYLGKKFNLESEKSVQFKIQYFDEGN